MFAYWHFALSASGYVCCCPVWSRFDEMWHAVKDQLGWLRYFVGQVSPVAGIVVCQSIQSPGYRVMSLAPAIIVTYLYHLPTVWHPAMRWLDYMAPMGAAGLYSGLRAIMRLVKSELTLHSSLIWFHFGTSPSKADWHYVHRLSYWISVHIYKGVVYLLSFVLADMDLAICLSWADHKKQLSGPPPVL